MILQHFIIVVFLIAFAAGAVVDQESPVFTYCPDDIVMDDVTTAEIRVNWQRPTATDNSGVQPALHSNRVSGEAFAVPGSYEILYTATDDAGNEATCSFRITLERKECSLYPPPQNGALACVEIASDRFCAVMCRSGSDFVFNPPLFYFCNSGEWNFWPAPGLSYSSDLPWPDCSDQAGPSSLNTPDYPYFFFSGSANDPNVQDTIKTNFIDLMSDALLVPPFFCQSQPEECNKDTTQVYAGDFIDQESPVFTYCPNDIVVDDVGDDDEIRVNWQMPTATDNSGEQPALWSNKEPGSVFAVPGSYEIHYKAIDGAGNEATCTFQITLKRQECTVYAPPQNGALACVEIGSYRFCAVMCKSGSDFVFNPPLFYFCNSGQWSYYSAPGLSYSTQLPWPDCSDQAGPSLLSTSGYPYFYFSGDANDPNVQDVIKTNFISLMTLSVVPPFFCLDLPADCNKNTTKVYAGDIKASAPSSCKEIYDDNQSSENKAYMLQVGSESRSVYCNMDGAGLGKCGGGGWTMVMKIDGSKQTFHYDSPYWTDNNEYGVPEGETGLDHGETKLATYWNTNFTKICLGMATGQDEPRFIVLNQAASSLFALIGDGNLRATTLGRDEWKELIDPSQASLQLNCNREGFNVQSDATHSKARIGIISNQENNCITCDSRIGFGTGGKHDNSNTCGNEATYRPDNGNKHIKAFGYILVQ